MNPLSRRLRLSEIRAVLKPQRTTDEHDDYEDDAAKMNWVDARFI